MTRTPLFVLDPGPMPLGGLFDELFGDWEEGQVIVVGGREFLIPGRQIGKTASTDTLLAVEITPIADFQGFRGYGPGPLGRACRGTAAHLPVPEEPISRRRARRLRGRARGARS